MAYAVTELLAGRTLRDVLREGRPSQDDALGWAAQVLSALREAHAKGIVHRDLKPENLFLTRRGEVKVLDFGLAVVRPALAEASISRIDTPLTAPGAMVGTWSYMSPEQIRGDDVDPRTDLFSFGIVLYEMLAGLHPFLRKNATETLSAILLDPPPPAPGMPLAVQRVIGRCLAKDPGERWSDAGELATRLEEAASPRGLLGRLGGWLGGS
jgi:serine/threonine protein kinase